MWVYHFMDNTPLMLIEGRVKIKLWIFDQFENELSSDVFDL